MSLAPDKEHDPDWDQLREDARQALPEALNSASTLPDVLLPYQARLLATTAISQLVVVEKSRRIGMTWGVGADAVLSAGARRSDGGMDVLYIGYNLDMAREFIDVCAMWARAFIPASSDVQEFVFKDQDKDAGDKDINAFRIRFASGFEIVALTSKPRSLRGRQGYVIFDEAAFHEELEELLKAAIALLMWGGKVLVISTHDGSDNPFNTLIQEIRSGEKKGDVVRVTFDDAIADGLYERIALVTGKPDTPEAKAQWIEDIFDFYGDDANEELRVIPKAGVGAYMNGAAIEACMADDCYVARLDCPTGFELRPMDERNAFVGMFLENHVAPHLSKFDPDRLTGLGEDFGRNTDLTVLAFGQELRDLTIRVPLVIELKNMPIEQQKRVIKFVIEGVPKFGRGEFDATGNGLAIAEWAQEQFGHDRMEAIKITQTWYLTSGPLIKKHVDNQSLMMPRDANLKDDFRALRLVRGIPSLPDSRNKGRHGDSVIAFMMLLNALKADYQPAAYQRVPRGGNPNDDGRRVETTAGFGAKEGLW